MACSSPLPQDQEGNKALLPSAVQSMSSQRAAAHRGSLPKHIHSLC